MQERKIIKKSKSWKDLDNILKRLIKSKKEKLAGSVFEHLTKFYLEVAPQYKSKLKKVYLLNEVPTSIKKKLKLPNTDEGIDLIAETNNQEYWAIQCKYRSNKSETLKLKGDLSTFNNLAFTICKNISHAIVCSTVNRPPKKIELLKSVGFELLTTWAGLDRDNGELYKQIKARAVGKVKKPKKLKRRNHQRVAIKSTLEYFKKNDRGKIIMPCGTGKSLTAFWIAKDMKAKLMLISVPSLALLQQTLKVWIKEFLLNNIEPEWLCVCSDDTVKEEQDDYVTLSSDLGIKIDTDPRVIRNFLKKKTKKIKIVFTTYQSGRATAIGSRGFVYDLGIMDEAHKTVGSSTKPMAHLLHQKNIKIKKRLFMTATERVFRGDKDEYMSMDDYRDYGNLIYDLSFKKAINSKPRIISDYKIITFGITNPEIEEITQSNKYLKVKKKLKDITARELATAIALRKAIKKLNIKNAVSFHRSIKRAENFKKQQDLISSIYSEYGKLKTFHVRGDMPTSDRVLEMMEFEKENGLITNARCLTEGVDLPAIDCVCFTDPKRSKVDIVQAAGRALRLSKNKKFGYILIPIFVPDGADFSQVSEEQGFDDVVATVRALATTDKRIVENLRSISEGKKPKGGSPIDGITTINKLYKVEAEEFNKAVQLKVWNKVAIGNYMSFEEAKEYIQELRFKNAKEYYSWAKSDLKPVNLPYSAQRYYLNKGWKNWHDFLGLKKPQYLELEKAKEYVARLNLNDEHEWRKYLKTNKIPENIPKYPDSYYRIKEKSWTGWRDFLGKNYLDYLSARKFVHSLKLKNSNEWVKYSASGKRPKNIPFTSIMYKDHKNYKPGMADWIGTENIAAKFRKWRPFKKARAFVRKQNIKNVTQWREFMKSKNKPKNIPVIPQNVYKEFISYGDWFGTGNLNYRNIKWRSFKKAREYVRKLKLKGWREYWNYFDKGKIPKDIPRGPQKVYREFTTIVDWVGSDKKPTDMPYRSFEAARKFVRALNFKSDREWGKYCSSGKKPLDIPRQFQKIYKNKGYISQSDFLGTDTRDTSKYLNFIEARKVARKLNVNSYMEYISLGKNKKLPYTLPSRPEGFYKNKGWISYADFLGY